MPNISEKYEEKENCVRCGEELNYDQSRYCSRECVAEDKKKRVDISCKNCGSEFETQVCLKDSKKYCSKDCMSEDISKRFSGEGNPFHGKTHSQEFREKISEIMEGHTPWNKNQDFMKGPDNPNWKGGKVKIECKWCNEDYHVTQSLKDESVFCSTECADEWKREEYPEGGLEHVWKGGVSKQPYPFEFDNELKKEIRSNFGFECSLCGLPEEKQFDRYNRALTIHHIDYNKQNISIGNLIPLCQKCHGKTNYNRDFWKSHLSFLNRNLYLVGFIAKDFIGRGGVKFGFEE